MNFEGFASGTFAILVAVNPAGSDVTTHYGSIRIVGTGTAKGIIIVNVTFKPISYPADCDLDHFREVDEIVERAKAEMSLLSNNKTLKGAQATLKTRSCLINTFRSLDARELCKLA